MDSDGVNRPRAGGLARLVPLAGVVFALLSAGGDLIIGAFPDGSTSTSALTKFYGVHHSHVALGGMLYGWGAILFALFGAALWSVARRSQLPAFAAGAILVGTAVETAAQLNSAATYMTLSNIGTDSHISPGALQAWHIAGSEFGLGGGTTLLLLGVAVAGIAAHAVPKWLAWSGLVIGIAQLTPVGFLASLLFLLWAAVAGLVITLARPRTVSHVVAAFAPA